jgi:hypothetical protein
MTTAGCWCGKSGQVVEQRTYGSTAQDGRIISTYAAKHKGTGKVHFNEVRWNGERYATYDAVGIAEDGSYTWQG